MLSRNVGNQLQTYARATSLIPKASITSRRKPDISHCVFTIFDDAIQLHRLYSIGWQDDVMQSWLHNWPEQNTPLRRVNTQLQVRSRCKHGELLLHKTSCAAFYSAISIRRFHTSETKYANFFFALFLASHYCNQINFPLRFHISHARPQAVATKWFTSLRDVTECSTCISDDVVSDVKARDTNIFKFMGRSPTRKHKEPQSTESQNKHIHSLLS